MITKGSVESAEQPSGSDRDRIVQMITLFDNEETGTPVTTDQVRIQITGSRLEPTLAELGLFKQSVSTLPPTISDRSPNGTVALSNLAHHQMVYTVDGSTPTTNSAIYTSPIALPMDRSVTVRTASLLPAGQLGIEGSRIFAGLMPAGWKVVRWTARKPPGRTMPPPARLTATQPPSGIRLERRPALPHKVTVDMGESHRIGGFTYLPRQDGSPTGWSKIPL